MKLQICAFLIAIALAGISVTGQDQKKDAPARPNFSGTWEFVGKVNKVEGGPRRLEISHSGEQLQIVSNVGDFFGDRTVNRLTLFTDDRGERNEVLNVPSNIVIDSKTKWEKDKLVRRYSFRYSLPFAMGPKWTGSTEVEVFRLSKDGTILTIETTSVPDLPARVSQGVSSMESPRTSFTKRYRKV